MKRVSAGEPISFVTLFGILRLRATDSIPQISHFLHLQITEKVSPSAKTGRNQQPLTERAFHDEGEVKVASRIALKVSDSEHCSLVWLTQNNLNEVQF